jgi:hypothetical protein
MPVTGHARGRGRIGRNGVAADHMIVAYSRGGGVATKYEIAWVTVALQHLSLTLSGILVFG